MSDDVPYVVGKGRPPRSTQWKKGYCPNPNGRPRKQRIELPHEDVLRQIVTVTLDGVEQQMSAEAAFMHYTINKALGDPALARALSALEKDSRRLGGKLRDPLKIIQRVHPEPGDVTHATRTLRMTQLLDGFRPSAYVALELWVIEAALARLGDRRLSASEQEVVIASTRARHKVAWPEWWTARPSGT